MSSASEITRDDFVPGAGSSSYKVTTGPGQAWTISPLTLKSSSTPSSSPAFCWSTSTGMVSARSSGGSVRNSIGGSWKPICGSGRRTGAFRMEAGLATGSASTASGSSRAVGRAGVASCFAVSVGGRPICNAAGCGANETRRFTV